MKKGIEPQMARKLIKICLLSLLVLFSVLVASLTGLLIQDRKRKLFYLSRITSLFSKALLKILGVRVYVKNLENSLKSDNNHLIVSNHLSYIDIFVISSVIPSIFVASIDEVRDKFLLSRMAKLGGSIFVDRRSRARLSEEIDTISELLKDGFSVVLFPEGTTSNGECVLSFKAPFLAPAIKTKTDILPVCLRYRGINGEGVNPDNRDFVFYYGDMDFFRHFVELLSLSSIDVELIGLENIRVDSGVSRKEVTKLAFDFIKLAYQ